MTFPMRQAKFRHVIYREGGGLDRCGITSVDRAIKQTHPELLCF